jgi:hypothetical protein
MCAGREMGPLELLRLVVRLFRIDFLQTVSGVVIVAFCTSAWVSARANTAWLWGQGHYGSKEGLCLAFSFVACVILLNVARRGVKPQDGQVAGPEWSHLGWLYVAAVVLTLLAALGAAIAMTIVWSGYRADALTVLAMQAGIVLLSATTFWVSDRRPKK